MTEPIFLQGICKDYLWGGNRLREEFGKESDADKIAESWELACHKDGSSILTSGSDAGLNLREYLDKNGTAFLGTNCADCTTVPVLIKLIDAKQDLSIQVHPDDDYAMRVEGEAGKTEMWYIVDAAPHAALYYGLKQEVTKAEFEQRIHDQTLTEILNRVEVKPGELYFIPSGTLHAIGAGILLAEIQQNSNTTYRVYDYGRRGADGRHGCIYRRDRIVPPPAVPVGGSHSANRIRQLSGEKGQQCAAACRTGSLYRDRRKRTVRGYPRGRKIELTIPHDGFAY